MKYGILFSYSQHKSESFAEILYLPHLGGIKIPKR